jgi:hypothetical protein
LRYVGDVRRKWERCGEDISTLVDNGEMERCGVVETRRVGESHPGLRAWFHSWWTQHRGKGDKQHTKLRLDTIDQMNQTTHQKDAGKKGLRTVIE